MIISRINRFPLFMPEGGPAEGGNAPEKDDEKTKSDESKDKPADKDDNAAQDTEAKKKKDDEDRLKKQLAESQKKLAAYEAKEKEEADKAKSDEQKRSEERAENEKIKRENLILKTRQKNGFADSIFDDLSPTGETEDEIKEFYETHKAKLDEYVKAQGPKNAQGGGTGGGPSPKEAAEKAGKKTAPRLVAMGFVKNKSVV